MSHSFNSINEAVVALRAAQLVVVAEDKSPESRGFVLALAETINAEQINFMASKARGLICLALDSEYINKLELDEMSENANPNSESFTVSIDADLKFGVTTGISAQDRATTIQVAVANDAKASDLRRPGHIFPLHAADGGVLKRVGQAEAATDMAKLAGLKAAAVVCSILRDDGELASLDDLMKLAHEHDLKIINIVDLVAHRLRHERFVHRMVEVALPNKYSEDFKVYGYKDTLSGNEHIALVLGDIENISQDRTTVIGLGQGVCERGTGVDFSVNEDAERTNNAEISRSQSSCEPVLVRVHSACLVSDLFGSLRSDDGEQLRMALKQIVTAGKGVLVYLRDEGRGLGVVNQLKAYKLQDEGYDTLEADRMLGFTSDLRNFGVGAQILTDLGLSKIRILTNNPKKITAIEGYGLEITSCEPIRAEANKHSERYLNSKKNKLGHRL